MSQLPDDRRRTTTENGTTTPLPWVNLAALLLAAGGLFLPWITGNGGDRLGIKTDAGVFFAVVLLITILLTGPQVRRHERQTTWALVLSWYALLGVAVFEIVRLSALSVNQGDIVHIGPGLYCCTLAAAVGTAAATLAAADRWLAQCADPWMKTRSRWLPSVAAGAMLVALPLFGLLGHAAVHQPAQSVTAHRVAAGTHDGSIALGATPGTSATGVTSTTSAVATPTTSPITPTSAAIGNTGNTGLSGPGDLPPTAMDTIWPGYTGDPGTSYVWPGYLVPGNTGATGNSGVAGVTGVSGSTGNTGAPLTTTSTDVGAATSMQTPPGVSSGGGSGNSEAAD
jgi:hypothetical protein